MLLATAIGDRFSVISPGNAERYIRILAKKIGVEPKLASIRLLNMHVLELSKDRKKAKEEFVKQAKKAVEVDGADVIVPGCGFFTTMIREIQEALNVPVIDPGGAALTIAEALVKLNLSQSKKAYPQPAEKKRVI
jgi:allantoin racemase